MTLTLIVGILVALLATGVAVAYQRAPTRARCPECGGATQAVMTPPWLKKAAPRLQGRWCPQCSWEGLGRVGPEWVRGRRISHDSGFHWGSERFQEDWGFRWRTTAPPEPTAEPPHHPSGFRFATTQGDGSAQATGFNWRRRQGNAPGGFVFGRRPTPEAFEWGQEPPRQTFVCKDDHEERPAPGFRWKDMA